MNFNAFWKWLQICKRKIATLGNESHFWIKVSKSGQAGLINTSKETPFPFSEGDALRTWDRYHGLRQAEDYLTKGRLVTPSKQRPYLMTSSYAKSVNLIQNWSDYPEPYQCPPYIAAAIRKFLAEQKQTKNKQPKKTNIQKL